jgi:hypothetical protein
MTDVASPSLTGVVRTHWRSFAPAWVFPLFLLFGGTFAESKDWGGVFFVVAALPLFFWSFFRAVKPWRDRKAPYIAVVFWSMLVPFVVWCVAVLSRLFVIKLMQ